MMRDLIRRAAGTLLAAAGATVLAAGMVAAAPGVAGAAANPLTAVEAALPANATTAPDNGDPNLSVNSVSCASAGNCTAVGSYTDSSSAEQGLLLTQTSGTWATGVEAPLPANALGATPSAIQNAFLSSVSCVSPGNCTAVGSYFDSTREGQGLLLTETSGIWATGVEAALPANAATSNLYVHLNSVSCVSAGNCTAVGWYVDNSGNYQGLLLTETSGTWATGVEAILPADAGTSRLLVTLTSVSCASARNCTAVGSYTDGSRSYQGVLLTQTSGTWADGVEAVLPADAGARPNAFMNSVSCASAGNCTAVGSYTDTSGSTEGLLLSQTSGTWTDGVQAPLPANGAAGSNAGDLSSVSCASAGNCTAAGSYSTDPSSGNQGLLLTQTSGTWGAGAEAPLPADAAAGQQVRLFSVSCASAGNCTAAGNYIDNSGNLQGLLLTQTSGTWATGDRAPLPADAAASPRVFLNSVSCASADNCTAVGKYYDSSGQTQGLLLSQAPQTKPTTTALVSAPNPSASGQAVTYTATVSPVPDGGTIGFTDGTTVIAGCGAQPVSTSTGQATCQTTPTAAGSHNIVATFTGSSSFAGSTSAALTQVVAKTPCPSLAGCNLSGLSLANSQLPGADLSGANLRGTTLSGADLSGANLSGANLKGADLSGADLSGANLSGANLNGADLSGASLNGADLSGANLVKVVWSDTTCPDGTDSNADGGTCTGHL